MKIFSVWRTIIPEFNVGVLKLFTKTPTLNWLFALILISCNEENLEGKDYMDWYPRENYLKKIRDFYHTPDIIKVITGVRRCGKSMPHGDDCL